LEKEQSNSYVLQIRVKLITNILIFNQKVTKLERTKTGYLRKPEWIRTKLTNASDYAGIKNVLQHDSLHTICESGKCPNKSECWKSGTATFMILGDICTRNCKFCAVSTGKPEAPNKDEPGKVADAVASMKVKHCVLTSVDRDDLPDGGAYIWAETIKAIKAVSPSTTIEALIPDFKGNTGMVQKVIETKPEIISHNLETVRRLTPLVRTHANYDTSLEVLSFISSKGIKSKSGIMVGLGETDDEVYETMEDLLKVDCKIMTIGQYLQPSVNHLPVDRYVSPDNFEKYKVVGLEKGFRFMESQPLVRSSYHAEKHVGEG